MSAAFKRKGRTIWALKIRNGAGKWITISTRTRDPITARKMQGMIDEIGPNGERAQDILDAVISARLTLPSLYGLWRVTNRDIGYRSGSMKWTRHLRRNERPVPQWPASRHGWHGGNSPRRI